MKTPSTSRRHFLQQLGLFAGAMAASPYAASLAFSKPITTVPFIRQSQGQGTQYVPTSPTEGPTLTTWPSRPAASRYMGGFRAPKMDKVRAVIIGCGHRGAGNTMGICQVPGAEVIACCDIVEERAKNLAERVTQKTGKACTSYSGDEKSYITMLKELKPDAVFVHTSWATHGPICCKSMELGAHAFAEVPMGIAISGLWDMVDASEKYQRHCMMMENVNYGREELMYLNMVRQGVIGELLHGEAAYIHNLRGMLNGDDEDDQSWRAYEYIHRNGNNYPTHGLGPVAQYMNLCRTEDTFARLTSFSSPAKGYNILAQANKDKNGWHQYDFKAGDINTSILKTVMGRTIMLQWDESTPRPYSRLNLIQGTEGCLAGFPTRVTGEKLGKGNFHQWIEGDALAEIYERYEHPLWKRVGEEAVRMGGHGGMDYVMFYRIIECLRQGEPMDQNVYEGAAWSACTELTEKSVAQGGMPQLFPDFTRGEWKTTAPLGVIS